MVPIPVHIWEVIRRYPGIDLNYAEKTDTEIRLYVEREVDERLKLYEEANERSKGLVSLSASLAFGTADQPRDQQIAAGVEYFTKVREHHRQIRQAIKLKPNSRTAAFIKLSKHPMHLAISGRTMEFSDSAKCVAGCNLVTPNGSSLELSKSAGSPRVSPWPAPHAPCAGGARPPARS